MFDGDKKRDVREKIQTIRTTICNLCTTMYIWELQAGCFTNCLQQYFPSIKKNSLLEQLQFEYKLQLSI